MADPTTWITVADNAVKIGLGALLGGGFAVAVAWLNNKSQEKKAFRERRWLILEGVLESVDGAANAASVFWANLANAIYKRDKQQRPSDVELRELKGLEEKFFAAFTSLNSSGAKLLLLDDADPESKLSDLRAAFDAFFRIASVDNAKCNKEELDAHKTEISQARRAFYQALSQAYRRDA
jgi:hypothetical protein